MGKFQVFCISSVGCNIVGEITIWRRLFLSKCWWYSPLKTFIKFLTCPSHNELKFIECLLVSLKKRITQTHNLVWVWLNFNFKMRSKYFKFCVTALCAIVFILLMSDIWIKFNSNITSTGIKFTYPEDDSKLLPFLTGAILCWF